MKNTVRDISLVCIMESLITSSDQSSHQPHWHGSVNNSFILLSSKFMQLIYHTITTQKMSLLKQLILQQTSSKTHALIGKSMKHLIFTHGWMLMNAFNLSMCTDIVQRQKGINEKIKYNYFTSFLTRSLILFQVLVSDSNLSMHSSVSEKL